MRSSPAESGEYDVDVWALSSRLVRQFVRSEMERHEHSTCRLQLRTWTWTWTWTFMDMDASGHGQWLGTADLDVVGGTAGA